MGHFFDNFINRWKNRDGKNTKAQEEENEEVQEEEYFENPYLGQLRDFMEQILEKRKIPYAKFAPILVEGDEPEDILNTATLLSEDLNYLTIIADSDTYYEGIMDNMYEEHGLIVKFCNKQNIRSADIFSSRIYGNIILDFQKKYGISMQPDSGEKLYIPIFKKRWENCGNLDIAVPIGYNTVIVRSKDIEQKQPGFDRFEQAFYENK